jgi:hypothetical protein
MTSVSPRSGDVRTLTDLLEQVSAERMLDDTRALCAEVRLSGSPQEARAFDYLEAKCRALGLEVRRFESETLISLPGPASLRLLGPEPVDVPCITHSFVLPSGPDGVEGDLVYVGSAGDSDLRSADVAGKIAVVDGLASPATVRRLEEHGCFRQVFINVGFRHEMIISPVWGSPNAHTLGNLPRSVCVTLDESDGAKLKTLLQQGPRRARLTTEVDTGWRRIPTLTAEVQGPHSDGTFALFGAHVDSWHYGATDNATGNAMQLELARILLERRADLRRGVRFAFWSGHSHGRYAGSTWYADHLFQDLYDHCVLYVNVDTPGGRGGSVRDIIDVMDETHGLVAQAVETVVDQPFVGKRIARYADQSFWGPGVPSAFASVSEQPAPTDGTLVLGPGQSSGSTHKSGGFGFWWHTTEDTFDKVDGDNLRTDAQVVLAALWDVVSSPVLPFDYARLAQAVLDHLAELPSAEGVDLEPVRAAAQRFLDAAEALPTAASESAAQAVNEAMRAIGRTLIPALFTINGPFEHDPALPQGFLPGLAVVHDLAALEPTSPESAARRTGLVRQRNRIVCALLEAARAAEAASNHNEVPHGYR